MPLTAISTPTTRAIVSELMFRRPASLGRSLVTRPGGSVQRSVSRAVSHASRMEGVLKNLPVLHDQNEVLFWILHERNVGDRIAVDQDEVGERALFDDA